MDKKVFSGPAEMEWSILGLYLADYSSGLHVRAISRLLAANHRTVSLALKRLESRGVAFHKVTGRNKVFFLNLNNIITKEYIKRAESFKLQKLVERKFTIKKLLEELSMLAKSTPLILFGSYAKEKDTEESDIDLLIIEDENEKSIIKNIQEFVSVYKIEAQIQTSSIQDFEAGLREGDNPIMEIVKDHVILNSSEIFVDILWRHFHG